MSTSTPPPALNVLLLGASGFIGHHVHAALRRAGHRVHTTHRRAGAAGRTVDFAHATRMEDWLPLLQGMDAVVNTVGVLRGSAKAPMQAIHTDAPCALFDACAQAGVRRVLQLSALGIEHSSTPYARSKCAADAHLLTLHAQGRLQASVLRPSIIFGQGGASTRLFLALARLPCLLLPRAALHTPVQPLAVGDLADALATLLPAAGAAKPLPLGGPQALTLAALIASLRAQAGHAPARVWPLPHVLTQTSARLGDALPITPWGTQALALLSTPNVCDSATLPALIRRAAVPPSQLLASLHAPADTAAHPLATEG